MQTLLQDLVFALRMLRKNPGFAAVALLTLALGIGANTAIFSVVNGVLLRPLPFKEPGRIAVLNGVRQAKALGIVSTSIPDFEDWQKEKSLFERISQLTYWTFNLTGRATPERIVGVRVTGDFFPLLDTPALLGRTLTPEDNRPGSPERAVLSYGLWQKVFAGDPGVIGRTYTMNGAATTVVGVMPQDFYFPAEDVRMWAPMADQMQGMMRNERFLITLARLAPGVSHGQAQAAMDTISARLAAAYPQENTGWSVRLVPVQEALVGDVRAPLLLMLGAVGFVLLIACANAGNLLLSRAAARQRESAIRAALGASRGRMVQQFLTENLLLAAGGGALGALLALWGIRVLKALEPGDIPRLAQVRLDPTVFLFALGISIATGIFLGLLAAFQGSSRDLQNALQHGGRSGTAGAGANWVRSGLVVAEIALAFMLLIGGGLLLRSFSMLTAVDPGFHAENLLTMTALLTPPKYLNITDENAYVRAALEKTGKLPGVESVASISTLPLHDWGGQYGFDIEGRTSAPADEPMADYHVITPAYFSTAGIPLLSGRRLAETDSETSEKVVVINRAMARKYFPGEDPIGRRIRWSSKDLDKTWQTIVGVVGDVRSRSLDREVAPDIYAPYVQRTFPWLRQVCIVVRTAGDPLAHTNEVRSAILSVDPDQPLYDVSSYTQIIARSVAERRFQMLLLTMFAGLALILAVVGTYGVMSYGVAQRTGEIGIRMALGASPGNVLSMILRRGMGLALGGLALGLAGALALTRALSTFLYGVTASDPATFAGVSALLVAAALVACTIPARRATRIDPLTALRHE
jgi:putative ABC transport system permease protein